MRFILFFVLAAAAWAQPRPSVCEITDTGLDDAYVDSTGRTCEAGTPFILLTTTTANTGGATVSIDGGSNYLTIKAGGTTDPVTNAILGSGKKAWLHWDGTYYQIIGGGGGLTPVAGNYLTLVTDASSMTYSVDSSVVVLHSPSASAPTGACTGVQFVEVTDDTIYACRHGAWVKLSEDGHNHNASAINAGTLNTARLPLPTTSAIGGVQANAGSAGQFVSGVNTTTGALEYGTPAAGWGAWLGGNPNVSLTTTNLPASTAKWAGGGALQNGSTSAAFFIPASGTVRNLTVYCSGTNGRDADIELAIYKAGTTDTGIKVTIAASAADYVYTDTTHTYSVVAGDYISLRLYTTSTTGTGCNFTGWSMRIQ